MGKLQPIKLGDPSSSKIQIGFITITYTKFMTFLKKKKIAKKAL